jgi:hypothetical protein
MWEITEPKPVKLIIGILAADKDALSLARVACVDQFGAADFESPIFPFTQTQYYKDQAGEHILRQFLSIEELIDPGQLATIKLTANKMEEKLAAEIAGPLPRPVNLDPGIIEPSKLILASTKNFSHRIYIGQNIYAELTLSYTRGKWQSYSYTFPDFKESRYHDFLSKVRERLVMQLRPDKS